jgi:peptidoglycan/LPS O-acetylase OafA/YrhL
MRPISLTSNSSNVGSELPNKCMVPPGVFRILFAGLVVLHHSSPVRLGGWAVLVFFVLSGYWISKMWDEKYLQCRQPALTFMVSRWWRLFPVMAACIVLYFVYAGSTAGYSVEWALRQLPIIGSTWKGTPLPPQWSLDVEMQFYLAFVIVAIAGMASGVKWLSSGALWFALGAVGVGYASWYLVRGGSIEVPFLAPWAGLFCLGIGLHKSGWLPSRRLAVWLAALFAVGTVLIILWPETRSALWTPGSEAALRKESGTHFVMNWPNLWLLAGILMFVPYLALNVRQPSPRWDRELGNWAYPVYMFHWIPRDWYYAHVDWARPVWFNASLLVVNIAIAFIGGWIIYAFFDKPIDRLRSRWVTGRRAVERSIS